MMINLASLLTIFEDTLYVILRAIADGVAFMCKF